MEDIYFFNDTWSHLLLIANILTALVMMFYYMQVMCTLYVNDETAEANVVTTGSGCNQGLITGIQYAGVALLVL
jgi:NADH:ubiquinone oxidoreductase subunit 2 (subunit N)